MIRQKFLHLIRIIGAYSLQIIGRIKPIDKRTVILYAFKRKGLCCNPKYILKALLKYYPGKYQIYWVSEWPDTVEQGNGYKVIKLRSIKFYLLCSHAGYFITNDRFDETVLKRKGQIYINTWHGGGLFKKAGYDIVCDSESEKLITKFYMNDDYLIASSRQLQFIFQKAFRMNEKQILSFGMPRNDVLYEAEKHYLKLRKRYGFSDDTKVILYAPTYRLNENRNQFISEEVVPELLNALSVRFGGRWIFLYRMHYFDLDPIYKDDFKNIYCCNDYYDVQQLLCGVDVLISDYSSLLWDYTLLDRPVFRYAPDLDDYIKKERGFYLDYDKWPYPFARDMAELIKQIQHYDDEPYKVKRHDFLKLVGNYEHGDSSKQFVDWLNNLEQE